MRHLFYSCMMSVLTLFSLWAQSDITTPVELVVTTGSRQVTFKYNVLRGTSAQIHWGDGTSETLKDPGSNYGGVAKHTYTSETAKGTKVTIDGVNLTLLAEPYFSDGPLNVSGFGRIESPSLAVFDFSYVCTMEGNTTPHVLDVRLCPQLKQLKLNSIKSITLPENSRLESLEITKNILAPMASSLEGLLDLSEQKNLKSVRISNQDKLMGINLEGLSRVEEMLIYNNALLRELRGIKGLATLKNVNLSGNSLTYDQLPLFTDLLSESDVNYDQSAVVVLDPKHVDGRKVNLSFLLQVQDAKGQSYTTTFPNVKISTDVTKMPVELANPNQYTYADGVFTLSDEAFKKNDGTLADAILVGIEPKNAYYPHYAMAAQTNQVVAKVQRVKASGDDINMATVRFSGTVGGKLSVSLAKTGEDLVSGDKVNIPAELGVFSDLEKGYQVDYYEVNGVRTHEADQYFFFLKIEGDTEIVAHYKQIPTEGYRVKFNSTEGGVIEKVYYYDGEGTARDVQQGGCVPAASCVTFRSKADAGYELDYWLVNGVREPADGDLLLHEVYRDTEVQAVFKSLSVGQYKVNFTYGPGGYLAARRSTDQKVIGPGTLVKEGVTVYFVATPDPIFKVDKWYLDEEEQTSWVDAEGQQLLEVGVLVKKDINVRISFCKANATETIDPEYRRVFVKEGMIWAEGFAPNVSMQIYSLSGECLATTTTDQAYNCISLPRGLYLVKVAGRTYKVVW